MSYPRPIEKRIVLSAAEGGTIANVRYVRPHLYVQIGSREYVHKVPRHVFRRLAKASNVSLFYFGEIKRQYPHINIQDPK